MLAAFQVSVCSDVGVNCQKKRGGARVHIIRPGAMKDLRNFTGVLNQYIQLEFPR